VEFVHGNREAAYTQLRATELELQRGAHAATVAGCAGRSVPKDAPLLARIAPSPRPRRGSIAVFRGRAAAVGFGAIDGGRHSAHAVRDIGFWRGASKAARALVWP
jgi:hypothetical protein